MSRKTYPLSVVNYSFTCAPRYYLLHPWLWFKDFWLLIQNIFRRARYGFIGCDVWNMGDWITAIFPPMLRQMAEKGYAYPGHSPFETKEKWETWLYHIADAIEQIQEDKQEARNRYREKYMQELNKNWHNIDKDLSDKYWAEAERISQDAHACFKQAWNELGEHFYDLWD